ncbi:MAG: translation elongation factor Ts [Patescibacteria group bacterium]|nr:translation elongation factor Ts [Patescibacteria group bacterium]MDD5490340.1 translation elongation factor Ts [Patescibacteria group bacterium]
MSVDQNIVKLRELTGAGILDCKKALEESGGDVDKAQEILRKKGIAKAAKRAEREAKEGIVKVGTNGDKTTGYMVEFNSETDFVARNEKFLGFTEEVFNLFKNKEPQDLDSLFNLPLADGNTVKDSLGSLSGVIGEKLDIKRCALVSGGTVAAYSHLGGRIGVLVALDKSGEDELAYDVAMHIAASNPKYLSPENVPAEEVAKEKEIYREQLKNEGKPENIIDKILAGKMEKYYGEICLLNQVFIKNEDLTVGQLLDGRGVKIKDFFRFSLN